MELKITKESVEFLDGEDTKALVPIGQILGTNDTDQIFAWAAIQQRQQQIWLSVRQTAALERLANTFESLLAEQQKARESLNSADLLQQAIGSLKDILPPELLAKLPLHKIHRKV